MRAAPWRQASRVLCLLGGLGLPAIAAAAASGLFHCVGSQGEAVYTNRRDGYHHCRPLAAPDLPAPHRRRAGFAGLQARVWPVHDMHPGSAAAAVATAPRPPLATARVTQAPVSGVLRGAVYRVRRADGSLEYTNLPPATAAAGRVERLFTYIVTCMACNLHSPIHWQNVPLQWAIYTAPIEDASRRFGVDAALLRAVIHAESAFNPRAISLKGAQGLMQLMPATASEMGVADAFDASQNIHGGARYLAQLLQQFHGDIRQVAAAYNAGAGAVLRYGGVPPYAETQVYVQRVELLFHRYQARDQAVQRQARLE